MVPAKGVGLDEKNLYGASQRLLSPPWLPAFDRWCMRLCCRALEDLCLPELLHGLQPTLLLGRYADSCGAERCMSQVLLGDFDWYAAGDGIAGVRVPHPVRTGFRETFSALRIALPSQDTATVFEEALCLIVENRRCDALTGIEELSCVYRQPARSQPSSAIRMRQPFRWLQVLVEVGQQSTRLRPWSTLPPRRAGVAIHAPWPRRSRRARPRP